MDKDDPPPITSITASVSKTTSPKFKREKTIDAIFEDSNRKQRRVLQLHLRSAFIGIDIGNNLLAIRAMLPHGMVQKIIIERFCRPNNVSLKTVERYQSLANATIPLLEYLRRENPEYESMSDEEVLQLLPLTQAYELVKKLSRIDVDQKPNLVSHEPRPCPNGWITPKAIVECVIDLFKIVDVDPCAIVENDPFSATERIYAPVDGIAAETKWHGRMWINPGLKKINHGQWANRLLHEYTSGNVAEGLILLPACTNASYAMKLREFPRAFTTKPLMVYGPKLPQHPIKLPLMIVYVGPKNRFSDFIMSFTTEYFDVFVRAS